MENRFRRAFGTPCEHTAGTERPNTSSEGPLATRLIYLAFAQGVGCERRHPPEVSRGRGSVRLWGDLEDALDQARAAPRNLLELPPVLHRPAEAHRHGRARGTLH